jgi:2',3'-cyclic-nucleotide 2'-phosphodiesterase (5'-nucleotidase family)
MKILIQTLVSITFLTTACKPTRTFLADEKVTHYRLTQSDTIVADPSIEAIIKPYRVKLDGQMNAVIGRTAKELTYGDGNSLMGNWACDLILKQANIYYGKKVDFTAINRGGLRIRSLPKGYITRGKMYELMPFDNALVILTLDSAGVAQFFNHISPRGGWPIAGASFKIRNGKAENILIGGEILRGGKKYTFCVSDYIASGGDNADFLKNAKSENLNKLMRDAFIEGVERETKEGKILDAEIDNRIEIVNR